MSPSNLFLARRVIKQASAPEGIYGSLLPARMPVSTGSIVDVSTEAALLSAVNSTAPDGAFVRITANLNGAGATITFTRNASITNPITIISSPGVIIKNYGAWQVTGSGLRFKGLTITDDRTPDYYNGGGTIKPTVSGQTAHHIEIDGCLIYGTNSYPNHNLAQGILVGSGAVSNIQIWNSIIHDVGRDVGYDHGIYYSQGASNNVIANCLIYQPLGYALQLYAHCTNLIITCCTLDGGIAVATDVFASYRPGGPPGYLDQRGGVVIGDEDGSSTHDVMMVGCIVSNAPYGGIHAINGGVNNRVFDTLAYANGAWGGQPDFADAYSGGGTPTAGTIGYTNCSNANPLYVNRAAKDFHLQAGSAAIGKIDPARYGYIPPLDIDGNARITADAGCYRR